jgi:ribose 5-phosphate isomerase B
VRVYLGADHAGFELKAALIAHLTERDVDTVDVGALEYDPDDDYPPFCLETARLVVADPGSLGIVLGGSGNGEQIAANKVVGVRAALAFSVATAELARQHNDANVISLGARQYSQDDAVSFVRAFLETPFSGDPRHQRRIDLVSDYERSRG